MPHKRTSRAGQRKADLVPKRPDSQHKVESRAPGRGAIKSGRNMGGRNIIGERVRPT